MRPGASTLVAALVASDMVSHEWSDMFAGGLAERTVIITEFLNQSDPLGRDGDARGRTTRMYISGNDAIARVCS